MKSGFTLIELIVVIAIIGILSAIMIPQFSSFSKNQNLKQASLKLRDDLRSAQSRSVNAIDDTGWGLLLTQNSGTYQICHYDGSVCVSVVMLEGIVVTSSTANVRFAKLTGLPDSTHTVTLDFIDGGSPRTININTAGKIE